MKYIQEHCSICNKLQAMPVVQEDPNHPGLIWVRCPECQETKPLEISPGGQARIDDGEGGVAIPAARSDSSSFRKIVRYYRQGERFSPGDWIYHEEWNDTGRVVDTCRSKGGHEVIVVSFERLGTKRLVSNFAR